MIAVLVGNAAAYVDRAILEHAEVGNYYHQRGGIGYLDYPYVGHRRVVRALHIRHGCKVGYLRNDLCGALEHVVELGHFFIEIAFYYL